MNSLSRSKFRKIPSEENKIKEEIFINKANYDYSDTLNNKKVTSFLIRMPIIMKKRLKKLSYITEENMNQICLDALDIYLKNHLYKTEEEERCLKVK